MNWLTETFFCLNLTYKSRRSRRFRVLSSRFLREKFTHRRHLCAKQHKNTLKTGLFADLKWMALSMLIICKSS
jgi:hypothetical protein